MKKWIFQVVVAIVALMPLPSAMVSAQNGAGLSISETAAPTVAAVGETVTFSYSITNADNVTISGITLQDSLLGNIDLGGQTSLDAGENITATATHIVVEADLPGPLVTTATVTGTDPNGNVLTASATATVALTGTASLQVTKSADRSSATPHQTINYSYTVSNNGDVTINNLSLNDDKLGAIPLSSNTLSPGQSATATASYTVTIADLPGPIANTATVSGTDTTGQSISASSGQVSVTVYANFWEIFKSEILKLRGVPGKGIEYAPGLQKPFNPRSHAAEHAGPKCSDNRSESEEPEQMHGDDKENGEQLENREQEHNQGTEHQLQIREEVQNQAGGEQSMQDDDAANHGKVQLNKNGNTDNRTGGHGAASNGHESNKDKKNNSKSGK